MKFAIVYLGIASILASIALGILLGFMLLVLNYGPLWLLATPVALFGLMLSVAGVGAAGDWLENL